MGVSFVHKINHRLSIVASVMFIVTTLQIPGSSMLSYLVQAADNDLFDLDWFSPETNDGSDLDMAFGGKARFGSAFT